MFKHWSFFLSSFQIYGPLRRDEHVRDGGQSGRDGLHQVHGVAARRAAQEAAGALLPGAGVRAGAALQAAEVPVRPGAGAPGRADPPHPEPGEDLVPEPPLQAEAAGQGQELAAAAAGRRRRRERRRSVRDEPPLLVRVAGPLQEELPERLQRLQPDRKPTGRLGRGLERDPAAASASATTAAAAAGEPSVLHGRAGGFVPESAAGTARSDQHDADGRGANRVHKQHDRLQFTVRENLVGTPRGTTDRIGPVGPSFPCWIFERTRCRTKKLKINKTKTNKKKKKQTRFLFLSARKVMVPLRTQGLKRHSVVLSNKARK